MISKKNSCYPAGHYYSPIIDVENVKKREGEIWKNLDKDGIEGIDLDSSRQITLVKDLSAYYEEMPFEEGKKSDLRYFFENDWYPYTDGILLYSMIRHNKPKKIIEVGSGYSSAIMLDVNELFFDNNIQLTFIEPHTERLHSLISKKDKTRITIIEKPIQEVSSDLFLQLEEGDILFVDSTHVVKTDSDVHKILFEVLPVLKRGVLIHFHDIFYPFEYPKQWVFGGRNWNESYFLRAFLFNNDEFKIKLFSHYLHRHHKEAFSNMPLSYKNPGGSLWLEKK